VNDRFEDLLDLCFGLLDGCQITPYYFYMCDLIPNSEHWRVSLAEAQDLQDAIMGYLPGFATPRVVCDVPRAGKHFVHQAIAYDRVTGVSSWKKNYRTKVDAAGLDDVSTDEEYYYYDPVPTLPAEGQAHWAEFLRKIETGPTFIAT
jgi:lysine 2,3-aminomutase